MSSKEFELFSSMDLNKYEEGEYIIIVGKKVVAHAKENLKDVLQRVRKQYAGEVPLVAKIPSKETLIL